MRRKPKRKYLGSINRPSGFTLVIVSYPLRFLTEPSPFSCRFDTLDAGLLKCGVLLRLNASARIWACTRSVIRKSRKMFRSRLVLPGPRRVSKPAFPNDAVVTGVNAKGLK